MAKILEETLFNNQSNNFNNSQPSSQSFNNSLNQNSSQGEEPGLMNILVSAFTPLIPVVLAKLTGQKLPANTNPNDQTNQQLTLSLQTIINNQNVIFQELAALKNNAQSLANNFQSLRLTHEKKQIDFNTNKNLENYEN
jgi:hypothetical protein